MKIAAITDLLGRVFPTEYQEDYDNSGFLVGDPGAECTGVLVTVDVTPEVVDEAVALRYNLIVSHHPLIFGGVKRITPSTGTGRMIMRLIENHVCVYSAHTNLDNMAEGVNGILMKKLGIVPGGILRPMIGAPHEGIGAGMYGELREPMATKAFVEHVKRTLGLPVMRTSELCRREVKSVAVCGGAGSFLIGDARRRHVDIYLTGDLKYHDFQQADGELILADIGHYESEQFAKEIIYRTISENFRNFACRISDKSKGFVLYI